MPLSGHDTSTADRRLNPVPLPDDSSGRIPAIENGIEGLYWIVVTGLVLAGGGYGTGYLVQYWPTAAPYLNAVWSIACFAVGVWVIRRGVANPWIRKYERWRSRAQDWRQQALDTEAQLDWVARVWTREDDPATARRLMYERLERLKTGPGRGRPRGSRTAMDHETWLEKAREVRKLRRQEMTWDNIGKRLAISGDTARDWLRSLEAEEADTA